MKEKPKFLRPGNGVKRGDNLALSVYRKIRKMMLDYEIVPGQRLIFSDLAERLNVSRTPVNSALSILAKEGFLDFVPFQGYTVHRINRKEAASLYEIIRIIAVGAIGKAILRLTPEKLKILEHRKNDCEKAVVELGFREKFILDQEFHAYIIDMSDIQGLADYFKDIYQQIYLRHSLEGLESSRARQVVSEHQQLFDAIRQQDVDHAKALIKAHLDAGMKYIFSRIITE